MIEAVIFDMDGLMLDTERVAQVAWQRAARDWGYDFPEATFRAVVGRNLPDVERTICENLGADFPFDEVYHRKQAYVQEHINEHGLPLKPGLLELLEVIERRGLKKAVASSSPSETITRNLARAGLSGRFDVQVGGDQIERGKPYPDIFLAAAQALGVPPQRCLALEDSNAGIEAAHSAGMRAVMIPDLIPPTAQTRALAHRILPSLHQVGELLS